VPAGSDPRQKGQRDSDTAGTGLAGHDLMLDGAFGGIHAALLDRLL
jgi:hypothetical protein